MREKKDRRRYVVKNCTGAGTEKGGMNPRILMC